MSDRIIPIFFFEIDSGNDLEFKRTKNQTPGGTGYFYTKADDQVI